jgi:hypothetical protein
VYSQPKRVRFVNSTNMLGIGRGTIMDRIRDILLYVAAAFAMLSFACAVYQAMNDKLTSAGVLAAISVACTLLVFFPKLEMFKAFGVEARLSKTLDRAEEILQKLQRLSIISARTSYMTMAWGNRMGTPSAKDKQAVLDEVDQQLADLKVSAQERDVLKRPYVQLIGFDFFMLFTRVFDRYASWKNDELIRQLNANHNEKTKKAFESFSLSRDEWRRVALGDSLFERLTSYKFAEELQRAMPTGWLDERERKAAQSFGTQMVRMFEECERKGGYTPEAADFYDRYHDLGGYDEKIKELFGVNPSELR